MYGGSACLRTQQRPQRRRREDPARSLACLLRDGQAAPPGYGLYLMAGNKPGMRPGTAGAPGPGVAEMPGPVLRLGPELAHLDAGDIIHVPERRPPGHRAVEELRPAQRPAAHRAVRQLLPDVLPAAEGPRRLLAVRPGKEGDQPAPGGRAGSQPYRRRADAARGRAHRPARALQAGCARALGAPAVQRPPFRRPGVHPPLRGRRSCRHHGRHPGLRARAGPARFHRPGRRRVRRDGARHPQPGLARPGGGDPGCRPAAHRSGARPAWRHSSCGTCRSSPRSR